jgi:hypothetical protein
VRWQRVGAGGQPQLAPVGECDRPVGAGRAPPLARTPLPPSGRDGRRDRRGQPIGRHTAGISLGIITLEHVVTESVRSWFGDVQCQTRLNAFPVATGMCCPCRLGAQDGRRYRITAYCPQIWAALTGPADGTTWLRGACCVSQGSRRDPHLYELERSNRHKLLIWKHLKLPGQDSNLDKENQNLAERLCDTPTITGDSSPSCSYSVASVPPRLGEVRRAWAAVGAGWRP